MKIHGVEGMSPENIRDEVNRGGRLVIYTYCVSILVMTLKRPAGIRLIKAGHSPAAASWPWVIISLLFGWWGIPWGPIYTIQSIYHNLCGGIDVTDDVLRQILPAAPSPQASPAAAPPTFTTPPPTKARGFNLKVAGLMLGGVCAAATIGISVYCFQQQHSLTVVLASGLAEPYSITLNGQPHTLKPYAAEVLELPEGDFVLADAPGGKVVGGEQHFNFSLPFFTHLSTKRVAVINPDHAAIFVNSDVPYYSDNATPPKDERPVFSLFVNQLTYFIPKPDFVIVEADRKTSMPSGTTRLVKTRLFNLRVSDLAAVLQTLIEKSGYPAAREHLMILARHRTDEELLQAAAQTLKPEDLRPFFLLHLADRPVLVEWHRYYQNQMEHNQPDHDLLAEYRSWVQAEPGNGALLYLLGRQTIDPAEQTRLWHAALAANPPCAYAHGAMGFDALSDGRFADAVEHYEASRKAGVSSTGMKHYRRQAYFALGQTAEILPELAALRKQDPLDVILADEEIRATYAIAHDAAAVAKFKDAYLTAYKTTKPTEKNLTDADIYLQATIAYVSGDLPTYARLVSRFESPFYQFRTALTSGKLEDAVKVAQSTDASAELLLYLLAQRKGDAASADKHFQAAHQAMKKNHHTLRQIAAQLDATTPDARFICGLSLEIETKRILLTALGVRYPADRNIYFELARKLNYNMEFPHQFLRLFLNEQSR